MSSGKYRVHPKFDEYGAFGLVERHTMEQCDEVCGCGQVTCPCMEFATCFERNYYCCDGRMPRPANCTGLVEVLRSALSHLEAVLRKEKP